MFTYPPAQRVSAHKSSAASSMSYVVCLKCNRKDIQAVSVCEESTNKRELLQETSYQHVMYCICNVKYQSSSSNNGCSLPIGAVVVVVVAVVAVVGVVVVVV